MSEDFAALKREVEKQLGIEREMMQRYVRSKYIYAERASAAKAYYTVLKLIDILAAGREK